MNWKSTWILLTAAVVIFGYVWLVERPIRRQQLQESNHVILPGFDPAAVTNISIEPHGADEIQAARVDNTTNQWQLTEPIPYPALAGSIRSLLAALPALEWQERITASELKNEAKAQEKFGFTQPQFELAVQGVNQSEKILIGQSSAMGDQVFLEVVGRPDIYLVNAPLLKLIPSDKDQWRDRSLLNLAGLGYQSVRARSSEGSIQLQRDPANHLWFMTSPIKARADSDAVNKWLDGLQRVRVRQFITDDPRADLEPYGLQTSAQTPRLDLSFLRGTNVVAELQVGASPSNQPALAFARRQDPPNVVTIDRDPLKPWQGAYSNFLDYHFISISPDSIGSISVLGDGRFSVEKLANGQWQVHANTTFSADAGLMREWLASFTNIPTQIEKTVATDLQPYGLTRPALQYTLQAPGATGPSNGVIASIEFGASRGGRVFERRADESSVNLISADDFNHLPRAAWQLRDRRIWSFDTTNVVSLTIHQLGAERQYLRVPGTNGDWTFAPKYHGPPVPNWPELEEGVHRLGNLRAVYWTAAGDSHWQQYGFDKANFSVTLELKRGDKTETLTVEFGERSPYSYPYASVMQNGQRLIFEFPVDLYENFVEHTMTIPAAWRVNP